MKIAGNLFKYPISLVFGCDFISDRFIELINEKLANDMYERLGINKQTKEVYLSLISYNFSYITLNNVQKLKVAISVRDTSYYTTICWKKRSKMGLLVRPRHTEIDSDDIEMWFEDLPIDKIKKEYYKSAPTYGIQVNHLSYPVEFGHFEVSLYLLCYLNDDDIQSGELIIQQLNDFVNNWNNKSDYKGGAYGVIHNSNVEKIEPGFVQYYIDWGSASKTAMDELLTILDETKKVKKLKITSYP